MSDAGSSNTDVALNDNLPPGWGEFPRNAACTKAGHECIGDAPSFPKGNPGMCLMAEAGCNAIAAGAKEMDPGAVSSARFPNGRVVIIPTGGPPPYLGPKLPMR